MYRLQDLLPETEEIETEDENWSDYFLSTYDLGKKRRVNDANLLMETESCPSQTSETPENSIELL